MLINRTFHPLSRVGAAQVNSMKPFCRMFHQVNSMNISSINSSFQFSIGDHMLLLSYTPPPPPPTHTHIQTHAPSEENKAGIAYTPCHIHFVVLHYIFMTHFLCFFSKKIFCLPELISVQYLDYLVYLHTFIYFYSEAPCIHGALTN